MKADEERKINVLVEGEKDGERKGEREKKGRGTRKWK